MSFPVIKRYDAQWMSNDKSELRVRPHQRKKGSSIPAEVGALIVGAFLLAAGAVDPSPVYAKEHRLHSVLHPAICAQVTSQSAMRATRSAADTGRSYGPTRPGEIINYADYQRGGAN
jgi:hypothetical protein